MTDTDPSTHTYNHDRRGSAVAAGLATMEPRAGRPALPRIRPRALMLPTARLGAGLGGLSLLALAGGTQAAMVHTTFDTYTPATSGSSVVGNVVQATQIDFTNVATDAGTTIDARVTAALKDDTQFGSGNGNAGDAGYIPDYTSGASEPNDDLGFLFYGNGIDAIEDGIVLTFSFFDGTGGLSGTFSSPFTIAELEFAIYDVDGESIQSEFFRLAKADGLSSYRLGSGAQALTATDLGSHVLFEGPGTNFPEDDASGAAILVFEDTDGFTLDFGAVQSGGGSQNGVFTGFDGDLSLVNPNDFDPPVSVLPPSAVPAPGGLALMLGGLAALWSARVRGRARSA